MSTVTNIIESMIRTYPTLYRSRITALLTLFDANAARWVDGELVPREDYSSRNGAAWDPSAYLPYPKVGAESSSRTRDRLFELRENAKAQFTHDNAALIASDASEGLGDYRHVRFGGARFDDMPENVSPEWLDAAKELALGVMVHKPVGNPSYTANHIDSEAKEHAKTVKICSQFLERFKLAKPCPYARAARVRELQREAQALGMILTESDGTAPRCNV